MLKDSGQKLTSVTFKYTGGGCSASSNSQDSKKATCSGAINPSLPANIASSNGYGIAPSTVSPGGTFVVNASKFDSNSNFTLSNAGGTESLELHTSCSQPLAVGDVFGNLTVSAINGQTGGADVTYVYRVTDLGDALSNVNVTDDVLGPIAGPFSLAVGESKEFQTKTAVAKTTTNTASAFNVLAGGAICPDPAVRDSVTVTVRGTMRSL